MISKMNDRIPLFSDTRPKPASAGKQQESFQSTLQTALAQGTAPAAGTQTAKETASATQVTQLSGALESPVLPTPAPSTAQAPDNKPWASMTEKAQMAYMQANDAALDAQGDTTTARSWMLGWVPAADMTTEQLKAAYAWTNGATTDAINWAALLQTEGVTSPGVQDASNWIIDTHKTAAAPFLQELIKRGVVV